MYLHMYTLEVASVQSRHRALPCCPLSYCACSGVPVQSTPTRSSIHPGPTSTPGVGPAGGSSGGSGSSCSTPSLQAGGLSPGAMATPASQQGSGASPGAVATPTSASQQSGGGAAAGVSSWASFCSSVGRQADNLPLTSSLVQVATPVLCLLPASR